RSEHRSRCAAQRRRAIEIAAAVAVAALPLKTCSTVPFHTVGAHDPVRLYCRTLATDLQDAVPAYSLRPPLGGADRIRLRPRTARQGSMSNCSGRRVRSVGTRHSGRRLASWNITRTSVGSERRFPMFFTFPEDARWNPDRMAVEFGVEVGEYRGV